MDRLMVPDAGRVKEISGVEMVPVWVPSNEHPRAGWHFFRHLGHEGGGSPPFVQLDQAKSLRDELACVVGADLVDDFVRRLVKHLSDLFRFRDTTSANLLIFLARILPSAMPRSGVRCGFPVDGMACKTP